MSTPGAAPASDRTLDFGRALRFVPEDPDWIKKILLGGLFTLLSPLLIGAVFVAGYFIGLVRRAARGEPRPLPGWDDLGALFNDGLRTVGLYLVHLAAVLILPATVGCVVAAFSGGIAFLGSRHDSDAAGALLGLGFMGLYALLLVANLLLLVYLPAALVRFALTDRFGAAFEVRENFAFIQRNLLNYVLALALYLVASFVAQFGAVLCCIGVFPASFWATCILGWALGETARQDAVS